MNKPDWLNNKLLECVRYGLSRVAKEIDCETPYVETQYMMPFDFETWKTGTQDATRAALAKLHGGRRLTVCGGAYWLSEVTEHDLLGNTQTLSPYTFEHQAGGLRVVVAFYQLVVDAVERVAFYPVITRLDGVLSAALLEELIDAVGVPSKRSKISKELEEHLEKMRDQLATVPEVQNVRNIKPPCYSTFGITPYTQNTDLFFDWLCEHKHLQSVDQVKKEYVEKQLEAVGAARAVCVEDLTNEQQQKLTAAGICFSGGLFCLADSAAGRAVYARVLKEFAEKNRVFTRTIHGKTEICCYSGGDVFTAYNAELRTTMTEKHAKLLKFIYKAGMEQNTTRPIVSDVALAQLIWGGDVAKYPQRWDVQVKKYLSDLHNVHFRGFTFTKQQTKFNEYVLLSQITDMKGVRIEGCVLCKNQIDHGDIRIEITTQPFIEVVERLGGKITRCESHIEWEHPSITKKNKKKNKNNSVYWKKSILLILERVFDMFDRRILEGVIEELTKEQESQRPDRAKIYTADDIQGLIPGLEYVCFGGNGKRAGFGYTIGGTRGAQGRLKAGWLEKCGVHDRTKAGIIAFLDALARVVYVLGGNVQAVSNGVWVKPSKCEGYDVDTLLNVRLLIFGAGDYDARLRAQIAEKSYYSEPPACNMAELEAAVERYKQELIGSTPGHFKHNMARLKLAKFTQKDIAGLLGIDPAHLTRILKGKKNLTKQIAATMEKLVNEYCKDDQN